MASFSIKVESILDIDSSENVLLIAKWIKDSMQQAGQSINEYNFKITFQIGDLKVECEDESEFREHSLGQVIDVRDFLMSFNISTPNVMFFHISKKLAIMNEGKNISISCKERSVIQEVVTIMKREKERFESKENTVPPGIMISGNNNQIGVVNTGDNNQFNTVTAGNNNTITSQVQPPQKAQLGFWQGVFQFIVSNIVWVLIVAIILTALTVIGITQPDWLQF